MEDCFWNSKIISAFFFFFKQSRSVSGVVVRRGANPFKEVKDLIAAGGKKF